MAELPRIAIGTIQPAADPRPMLWAFMEAQRRRRTRVQSFFSRSCFPRHKAAEVITGLKPRYLDSWLMSEGVAREIFLRGSELGDMAVVEGCFCACSPPAATGGQLETLCQWLRLPRIVLLDASHLRPSLPNRPAQVGGVLLDRVADERQLAHLATDVETLWRVPVLGALPEAPRLRQAMDEIPSGDPPPPDLCREWGDRLEERWEPDEIDRLAGSIETPPRLGDHLYRSETAPLKITVAMAFDEAFNCYFPCGLDLLELRGATIIDFSPLRDEAIPPDADIVFLGCGHPERHAAALADNHCMMSSLRHHVRRGRRLYAEGGGLAYLCEQMETFDGSMTRMAGVFPAVARLNRPPTDFVPVETTLDHANWLAHAGTTLRGYRNPTWHLEPLGQLDSLLAEGEHPRDVVGSFQAVGSLLHLNFAAQEAVLNHFFYPHATKPGL